MGCWSQSEDGLENGRYIVGPPPSQDVLASTYLSWKACGHLDKVFYQGVPSVREFLEWHTNAGTVVIGCWERRTSDVVDFTGMGWINASERMPGLAKAEVGFCFNRNVSIFSQAALIRAMITGIFLVSDYESLFGTTPEVNQAAVALVKRTGMRIFGPVPMFASWHGEPCGVFISQADKKTWMNRPDIQAEFQALLPTASPCY